MHGRSQIRKSYAKMGLNDGAIEFRSEKSFYLIIDHDVILLLVSS
jgi:isoprenylcysteine carboxyl methyltransferase (ICMT) family protein YpbQ